MLKKAKNYIIGIFKNTPAIKNYGQQLLNLNDQKNKWGMHIVDVKDNSRLYLSFPSEKKRSEAKKAISASHQLYTLVLEKRETI